MKKNFILFNVFTFFISVSKLWAQTAGVDSSFIGTAALVGNGMFADEPGITQKYASSAVSISHNQLNDILEIKGLKPSAKTLISVSSSDGKIIYRIRTTGSNAYSINVHKLKQGIYFVTIKEKRNEDVLRFLKL